MADEQLRSSLAGYPSFLDRLDPRMQPVWVTKEHFEERGYNIIRFCSQFLKINGEAGLALTRPVVEFVWGLAVWRVYPTADPQKSRLMGQVCWAGLCRAISRFCSTLTFKRHNALCLISFGRDGTIVRVLGSKWNVNVRVVLVSGRFLAT